MKEICPPPGLSFVMKVSLRWGSQTLASYGWAYLIFWAVPVYFLPFKNFLQDCPVFLSSMVQGMQKSRILVATEPSYEIIPTASAYQHARAASCPASQ